MIRGLIFVALCFTSSLGLCQSPPLPEVEGVEYFRIQSQRLTDFWGRPTFVEAGVVLPVDRDPDTKTPVCYSIHGFGGSHREAWYFGAPLRDRMREANYPPMIYVYLNAQFPLGHHEFADSANNGPWGAALTEEFIPALEEKFAAAAVPTGRFLTGHSSGGWSSLWLQVTYPKFFGGTWSTAPDSVDFRDFTGIDIYTYANAYTDPQGQPIQLMRRRDRWVMTIKQYVDQEVSRGKTGGQFASFDAAFSPRGEDGNPMPLFDRQTGAIDPEVAKAWEKYDIRLVLKRNWSQLAPDLQGKLHIYVGTLDTYRLEGATRLLKAELETLGSDAEVLLVEGRNHGSLGQPHPEYWPKGMITHIHQSMWKSWLIRPEYGT
jgi:S-formylglutathione hydrolase FrmB